LIVLGTSTTKTAIVKCILEWIRSTVFGEEFEVG